MITCTMPPRQPIQATQYDLPFGTANPIPCRGAAAIDNLRHARLRLQRSQKSMDACAAEARREAERSIIGYYQEEVLYDLENDKREELDFRWYERHAEGIADWVRDAAADLAENDWKFVEPEESAWKPLLALSAAMKDYASAIRLLAQAEAQFKNR